VSRRPTDPLRPTVVQVASKIWPAADWRNPISIYAYYDSEGRALYVGQSFDLLTRHGAHRQRSSWFWDAAEFRIVDRTLDRKETRRLEARAIRSLRPIHNVHHNGDPTPSAVSGRHVKTRSVE